MKNQFLAYTIVFGLFLSFSSFHLYDTPIERHVSVKLVSTHQISNNRVGHDWENFLSVRKQIIKREEKVTFKLKKRAPLTIEAHAIEKDKNYDDHGKKTITFTYSDLIAMTKSRFEIRIIVEENGGQYAGNIAEWMYVFELVKEDK